MPKNTYHEYLKKVPLFADLDDEELDEVGTKATDVNMKAGSVIMREVTREGEHVADIGPGGFAGEMALITRTHRNSTVTAKTDVELLHIDGRDFAGLLQDVPRIAVKMLPVIVQRVAPHDD
jgi:CRP-like cAMP-binding protein